MGQFGKVLLILAASLAVIGCQSAGTTARLMPPGLSTAQSLPAGTTQGLPVSTTMPAGQASSDQPPGFVSF